MTDGKKIETETHHNQELTEGAAARSPRPPRTKAARKIVAIQMDEKEYAAYRFLGGSQGLKALLAPAGLCIKCRRAASLPGTYLDSLCETCRNAGPTQKC